MADNQKYQAWVKFKPGSSSTIAADIDTGGNKVHLEMTRTLISLDDQKAVVEIVSKATMSGQQETAPTRQETIPAKIDKDQIRQIGEKDVDAMGKTFKCRVYEAKGDPDAGPQRGPGVNPENMKANVYINDDVPGGVVRLESTNTQGKDVTFVLIAAEVK